MRRAVLLLSTLLLVACSETDGDYVAITGGGFIFNYRMAEAYYGVVAEPRRPVPEGTGFVAEFENPAGGDRLIERHTPQEGAQRISLTTPPLQGIEKGRDYHVVLRLENPETGEVLEIHEKAFSSRLNQSALPDGPLTVGPGYHRPPARVTGAGALGHPSERR